MANTQTASHSTVILRSGLQALAGMVGLALFLAWVASNFQSVMGWQVFLRVCLLGGLILFGGWLAVRFSEKQALPRWLAFLLIAAAVLRLMAGVLWFSALPVLGHDAKEQRAGYVMADAYERDQTAWELSQSEKPLIRAFQGYRKADQYGGLLYLSALIYRNLGGDVHQPLLIVILTAAFSALAVLFTWAFARRAWGDQTAKIAAWLLALYPEAILLGSSQMREAFTISLTMAAFYGLIRYSQDHHWTSLVWILGALLLYLPFSPPFAALLLAALLLTAWSMRRKFIRSQVLNQRQVWLLLIIIVVLTTAGLLLSWQQFAPEGVTNPLAMIGWWVRKSAEWQAHLNEQASGWTQKVFDNTPTWLHAPLMIAYGITRPFLPAALVAGSASPLWTGITIWRALGWTVVLIMLVYAPVQALRKQKPDRLARILSLLVWLILIIASFRGGGDQDDNPRYRAAFAGLQIALVAWAWVEQHRTNDVWFRRALALPIWILIWFLPWYLRRYTGLAWPVVDLFKTLGLGIASSALYWVWDWARSSDSS
jgi:hypothetical protein